MNDDTDNAGKSESKPKHDPQMNKGDHTENHGLKPAHKHHMNMLADF